MKSRSPQFFASGGTREVTCGKVTPWSNDAATTGYHCPLLASMRRIDCLFHLCVLPGARTTEVTDRTYTIRWPGPKSGGHRQEACGSAESGRQSNPTSAAAFHCRLPVSSLARSRRFSSTVPRCVNVRVPGRVLRELAAGTKRSAEEWADFKRPGRTAA